MKKYIRALVLSLSLYPLLFSFSYAGAPLKINFQGRLEENGKPAQGTKSFTFDVYDAQSGGALVWTSLAAGVAVANGVFSVVLEAGTPLNLSTATFAGARYVEITVDGITLSPRQEMVSAPYALVAQALSSDAVISLSNLEKDPSAPSVINTSTNAVDWTQLKNVPAGLANWTGAAATFSTAAITSGKFSDDRVYITTGAFYGGFNGADQIVRLDGTGKLAALDGSALTNVNSAAMGVLTSQVDSIAASTGTLTANLAAVVLSTAPLAGYANWNASYGWGNHALAGYGSAAALDSVIASTGTIAANLSTETTARSGADSALNTRVDNVAASTGTLTLNLSAVALSTGPLTSYGNWNTAYSWGNHALAGYGSAATIGSVITSTGTIAANLSTETSARSGADSALNTRVDSVAASTGTLTVNLGAETTSRSGADSALNTRVDSVAASTGTLTVNLGAETTSRSGADSALNTRVDSVAASTGTLTVNLGAETTARSGADSALNTRVDNVAASTGTLTINLGAETTARSGADSALNTRVDNVAASTGTLTVNLGAETTSRSGADSALNTRVDSVAASTGTLTVNLGAETTNRSGADSALNTRVDNVAASTGTLTENLAAVVLSTGALVNSGSWSGAISLPIKTIIGTDTPYTVTGNDSTVLVAADTTNVDVMLPSAAGISGRIYTFKLVNDNWLANIVPSGLETLDKYDSTAALVLDHRGDFVTIQSDGTNWVIIGIYTWLLFNPAGQILW
ncbi:MAG: hypothetical protein PHV36_14135 [Elusimicrobiales bacterium]|nr:hypothetical protein [Elusimicrobiales bacterium]